MIYTFDTKHAKKYGLDEAVFISNVIYWIAKNRANEKHKHDGRTWTYNSARAWAVLFPFWNEHKIRNLIDGLVDKGVLLKGNFNETQYDRTLWIAFVNENEFLDPEETAEDQEEQQEPPKPQPVENKNKSAAEKKEAKEQARADKANKKAVNFNSEILEKRSFYTQNGINGYFPFVSDFNKALQKTSERKPADFWAEFETVLIEIMKKKEASK